ncbi:MAG: hypothetical protein KF768_09805 [Phycisphaeraceae bacterium]|nr:hypothetical protein [Phycisphaeraceae bacterium]
MSVTNPLPPFAHRHEDATLRNTRSVGRGPRVVLRRLLLVVGGAFTFALVSSLIQPGASRATPSTVESSDARVTTVSAQLAKLPHPAGWPCLGLLRGSSQLVVIHGSPDGPRYSVYTLAGRLISPDLGADEVYREFPTLDIEGLRLEPIGDHGPLMLYSPRD